MVAAPSLRTKTDTGGHLRPQPRSHGIITTPSFVTASHRASLMQAEVTRSQCLAGGSAQEWRGCGPSSLWGIYQKDGKRQCEPLGSSIQTAWPFISQNLDTKINILKFFPFSSFFFSHAAYEIWVPQPALKLGSWQLSPNQRTSREFSLKTYLKTLKKDFFLCWYERVLLILKLIFQKLRSSY